MREIFVFEKTKRADHVAEHCSKRSALPPRSWDSQGLLKRSVVNALLQRFASTQPLDQSELRGPSFRRLHLLLPFGPVSSLVSPDAAEHAERYNQHHKTKKPVTEKPHLTSPKVLEGS